MRSAEKKQQNRSIVAASQPWLLLILGPFWPVMLLLKSIPRRWLGIKAKHANS